VLPFRLVIDTNILVSAALNPNGLQLEVLRLALAKPARLYVSRPILEEHAYVLSRPKLHIRNGLRRQLLQLVKNNAHVLRPVRRITESVDPDDNKFPECADAARADYLITGNLKHFPSSWKRTSIVTCREFLDIATQYRPS
jgi:putative PIN family toxin of toxin-antitoxin system